MTQANEQVPSALLSCAKCGGSFERPSGPGRPPTYCSEACKRTIEFELRRLGRRLGAYQLEQREIKARGVEDNEWDERERQRRLRALRAWIKEDEGRLRELLGATSRNSGETGRRNQKESP